MDPVTLMIATAVGGGISAYGSYQSGQASKAMYNYQAAVGRALGGAEFQAADVTQYAGGRAAESEMLKYGGQIARGVVGYGAGQVAGRTPSDVAASQRALAGTAGAEAFGRYANTAYEERLRGAEEIAGAGLKTAAATQAVTAGDISAVGTGISTIGKVAGMGMEAMKTLPPSVVGDPTGSVAPKWYQGSDLMTDTGPTTGDPLNLLG